MGTKAHTIEYVKEFCESIGIECEDNIYKNCKTKMNFKCKEHGHRWQSIFSNLYRGHFCPYSPCSNNKNGRGTIDLVREYCSDKNFKCKSKEYVNSYSPLEFECEHGHIWHVSFGQMKKDETGCPYYPCKKTGLMSIEHVHEFCSDKNFICTDSIYVNSKTKMNFKCNKCGHEWKTVFNSIRSSETGCPICNSSQWIKEGKCRKAIEELTGQSFICPSPSWLIYKNPMRFDGYNDKMLVAIEYNGEQHYKLIKQFKMTEDILALNKDRDRVKAELCRQHGVYLIVVPYWIKAREFKEYIKNQLEQRPMRALMAI